MCHIEIETLCDCEYFNNDDNLSIYSRERINAKQIFSICLNANVSENLICKKCPSRVNENVIFIIHQGHCSVKHPFDLQDDNIGGTLTWKYQVRFYKTLSNNNEEISLLSEEHVEKENEKVIGDKINS